MERSKARNQNVDLLKVLACIAVVGLHTLQKDVSLINLVVYYLCGFAVPVFFASSGYFLLNRGIISVSYIVRKILNILRVVIIWNVLIILSQYMLMVLYRQNISFSIMNVIRTIIKSLLQKGVLWQFWYFGALMIIYFFLPILSNLVKKGYALRVWSVLTFMCIFFQVVSCIIGRPIQKNVVQTFRLWTWLQYFILGSFIDKILLKFKQVPFQIHFVLMCISTIWIVLYQVVMGKYLLHNSYAEYFYDSVFTIIWVILIFTWVIRLKLTVKFRRLIDKLAPQTMGVYIIHPLLIRLCSHFIEVHQVTVAFIYFIVILSIAFVISYLINRTPLGKILISL